MYIGLIDMHVLLYETKIQQFQSFGIDWFIVNNFDFGNHTLCQKP